MIGLYFSSIKGVANNSGPALPILILLCFYVLYMVTGLIIRGIYGEGYNVIFDLPIFKKWFGYDEIVVHEGLDDYIESLSKKDIDWNILESDYFKRYGLKMFSKL